MKRFCLYVAAFAAVLSLILAGGIAFKCRYVPRHIDWSLPSGTRILLAGASHIQCDIDDSLIPGAVNIARSSERYLFTWLKLSRYFAANPELEAVVLECAPTKMPGQQQGLFFSICHGNGLPISMTGFAKHCRPGSRHLTLRQFAQISYRVRAGMP